MASAIKLKRVGLLNSITYGLIELKVKKDSGQYEKSVLIDRDVATLYGVETRALNQAVSEIQIGSRRGIYLQNKRV